MPARDRDHGTGRIDARALDDALVDGALETEHRPAHVANGGEAAHQSVGRLVASHEIVEADVAGRLCRSRSHQHRVPVIVDQAGHQRAAAAVDDARVGPAVDRDRLRGDALDDVAPDQHIGGRRERRALAVEDAHVLEQRGSAARRGGSRGLGPDVAVRLQCRSTDERRCARQDGAAADAGGLRPPQDDAEQRCEWIRGHGDHLFRLIGWNKKLDQSSIVIRVRGPMHAISRRNGPAASATQPAVGERSGRATCTNTALPRPATRGRALWSVSIMRS